MDLENPRKLILAQASLPRVFLNTRDGCTTVLFGGVDKAGGQIDPVRRWSIRDGRSSDREQELADNHGVKWSR